MRKPTRTRNVALAFVVAMFASLVAVMPASATTPPEGVSTHAEVGGIANPPAIECVWLLPDAVDAALAGPSFDSPDMQYGDDDDPYVEPYDTCTAPDSQSPATQALGATNLIQVKPNAHDEPSEQYIEIWAAIDEAARELGVGTNTLVHFDVYHPDGTLKVNVPATRLDSGPSWNCQTPDGMFQAAQTTGQLTSTAVSAMVWECLNQTKSFFYGAFALSKHQPYGEYRVEIKAETIGGAAVYHTVYFDVLPMVVLEKDFSQVSFGSIAANSHHQSLPGGDFNWDGMDQGGSTVRNTGNAGMSLDIVFDPLCLDGNPAFCTDSSKVINAFDVKYGKVGTSLQSLGTTRETAIPANSLVEFDESQANVTLCPNERAKIEFSIWTHAITSGQYSGVPTGIQLTGHWSALEGYHCPTDDGSVFYSPDYPAGTVVPKANGYWNGPAA